MQQILNLIGRKKELFSQDTKEYENELSAIVTSSAFQVPYGVVNVEDGKIRNIFLQVFSA